MRSLKQFLSKIRFFTGYGMPKSLSHKGLDIFLFSFTTFISFQMHGTARAAMPHPCLTGGAPLRYNQLNLLIYLEGRGDEK